MKQWPKDKNETVDFEELVGPLAQILRQGEWPSYFSEVFDIGEEEKSCALTPEEALSPKFTAYHKEQGRDLFDVVLGIAVQYGIEQGRRMMQKEVDLLEKIVQAYERST